MESLKRRYIYRPATRIRCGGSEYACLQKALYGLKQAPRAWYGWIDGFLMSLGFSKSLVDHNLFCKVMNDELVMLLLYVDDLFLTGNDKRIYECKEKLAAEFEMKDLGMMHYFLGLEVW